MNGQIQVLSWEGRSSLYVRFYDQANRRYVVRSLKTAELGAATDNAIQMWRDIQPRIEQGHPTNTESISSAIATYLETEQKRVDAGLVKQGTVRDKNAQLKVVLLYCGLEGLNVVSQVKEHSFNSFVAWRRDESLRITTGESQVMELTSLNKAIRELRAWWKWIRSKRLSTVELEIKEVTTRHERIRKKNVAFTDEHYEQIEIELLRQTKDIERERRTLLPSQIFARHHIYRLIQTLINSGMRPQEATNIIQWKDIEFRDQGKTIADKTLDKVCVISIINPRGKGSRAAVTDAGLILKLWRIEVEKYRKAVGLNKMKPSDLVFGNPLTGEPFAYTGLGNHFRAVLTTLNLKGIGYTIRSCRGYYITKMLAQGHTPYLVAKNVGHSMDVMRKSYEQLTADDLLEEFG